MLETLKQAIEEDKIPDEQLRGIFQSIRNKMHKTRQEVGEDWGLEGIPHITPGSFEQVRQTWGEEKESSRNVFVRLAGFA
jgi:hypothetical protein